MRSVVFEKCGEPAEVLSLKDVPLPEPRAGEVLVRMRLSPINPSDLLFIRGKYSQQPEFPAIPGFEGVGIVKQGTGSLLAKYLIGKRVAVIGGNQGHWRDFTIANARQVIPVSRKLSDEQAATFFVNPATALLIVTKILRVPRGGWLMQSAAGSALGRMVIRLGRALGFHTLNLVRRESQVDELKAIGADAVVVFDSARHKPAELPSLVHAEAGITETSYMMDCVGGQTGTAMIECLAPRGVMVVYGTLSGEPIALPSRKLLQTGANVTGFWLKQAMQEASLLEKLQLIRRLTRLIESGVLASEVAEQYTLDRVADAVRAADASTRSGKILVSLT